jgi:hypothetical protein
MVPGAGEPGEPESSGVSSDPTVRCPSCGAEVVPREGSYGTDEAPSVGLACPSCGSVIEPAS